MKTSIPRALTVALLLTAAGLQAEPARAEEKNPDVARLSQRLRTLDANADTAGAAAYERLQARQSVDALAAAKGKARNMALQIAELRVQTAEIAARNDVARREVDRLERTRSDLLVEASRQDAARARQEAERLRIQAQIQAEEAMRLREQADQEAAARQQAETALDDVAGSQAAKLKAARQRQAELARRQAELLGTGKDKPEEARAKP
ncbi:hypothetical protein [Luteimonas aquatica]|uniref:hypothetical protein n=1 Tax=Luteimonas aquatica TaxID=450364 RepID=UPI001F57086E|nr:hypothetical protein [Luteimonas aquatica]